MALNIGLLTPGFSRTPDDWAIPFLQNFAAELATKQHVRVIALRYPHNNKRYHLGDVEVVPLGFGSNAERLRRLRLWAATWNTVRRLHHERRFDVLHAIWSDETGVLASWIGRRLGIPVVTTITGGELVHFSAIQYGLQGSRLGRWTVGQALHQSSAVVISGSHSRELIRHARYNIPDSKIYSIVWGVDTTLFQPPTTPRETNRLLHVGSLVGIKNQSMLLRVASQLPHVTLDIIGQGPLLPDLQRQAADLSITNRVNFLGSLPYPQMGPYYQRAALYIMTSLNEGVPLTMVEAGACGLPTVSTAVGMLPDYPAMGVTVPVNDEASMVEAIRDLLADDDRRNALGQSAHETVRGQFSVQHTAAQYLALYEQLRQ